MATGSPLIVIVGPTASGKTSLAITLAEKYGGEIICADSRTIYKDMDIGTAKPSKDEQDRVPHWGLDLVEPGERFTAADFKDYANLKIKEIRARNHIPFLVGGTGLYVDGVLFDYQFGPDINEERRKKLEVLSITELQEYCLKNNIKLPENLQNKRHLIRAIEQKTINRGRSASPVNGAIIVGITTKKDTLRTRIAERTEQLFANDVAKEATRLGKKYGWQSEAMTANIYPLLHLFLENKLTIDQVKEKFITLDWQLAKRQLTWLRRNPYIKWLSLPEAENYLSHILANEQKS